jgi:hypothetical protein
VIYPKIDIKNETNFFAIKVAKAGFYSGNPELVKKASVAEIIRILQYGIFEDDWQNFYNELNK